MPQKMWKHTCPEVGRSLWMGTPICSSCRGHGEYDGWHYSTHEAMASYQSCYGLKPIGPHRPMADKLFGEATVTCEACEGRGLRDVQERAGWEHCPACRGLRVRFTKATDEIAEIRRRILDAFPDASAEPLPEFATAPLALDLSQSKMVDLSAEGSERPEGGWANESDVSTDEADEDPWRNVSAADVAAAIDRALTEDHTEELPSGRVFMPIGEVSLRSALLAAAPDDEDTQAAADNALEGMSEIEETLSRFTTAPPEDIIFCSVLNSMVSGCWGLYEFRLGARGYLYYRPDFRIGDDESLPVLGAWEPADDQAAQRACILRAYEREWRDRVLPPAMGEWTAGDPELLQAAILMVLKANPDAWEFVFDRLAEATEPKEAATLTVEDVARFSKQPVTHVRQVLRAVAARDKQFEERFLTEESTDEERCIVVALLVHCLAKDPLLNVPLHG
jgi:hypothetical protein